MQRSGERNFQTERMATARAPRYSMPGLLKRKQGGHCGWSRIGGVGSGKLESWEGARSHRALQAMVKPLDFTLSEMESITGAWGEVFEPKSIPVSVSSGAHRHLFLHCSLASKVN